MSRGPPDILQVVLGQALVLRSNNNSHWWKL